MNTLNNNYKNSVNWTCKVNELFEKTCMENEADLIPEDAKIVVVLNTFHSTPIGPGFIEDEDNQFLDFVLISDDHRSGAPVAVLKENILSAVIMGHAVKNTKPVEEIEEVASLNPSYI